MITTKPQSKWKTPPSPEDIAAAQAPTVYYDAGRKDYWIKNKRGLWIPICETALRRHLKVAGVSGHTDASGMSSVDRKLVEIQSEFDVAFAGPLSGYRTGLAEVCGQRILVTSEPKLITPVEGAWALLTQFLMNLFHDSSYDQLLHVYGWIKVAVEALAAGLQRPGQALVVAGPRGSGKSFFQKLLTLLLGGRAAKPYRYMTGGTDFNSELCGAEHLMIEDEIASTDIRARRHFGSRIKDFTVNEVQSLHAKNRGAISVTPFWRLSITLNDEPEDMLILPPMDESLEDKIILLKAQKRPMPMPTGTLAEREAFWKALLRELPAFLWFLTNWSIPKELQCERFGIIHYHHPDLLRAIESMAPEMRLLELIDAFFWPPQDPEERIKVKPSEVLEITATELESSLCSGFNREAQTLLSWSNAAGCYLGRLAQKRPDRVQPARQGDKRKWRIFAPKPESEALGVTV